MDCAAEIVNNKLYVAGGYINSGTTTTSVVEVFDITAGTWSSGVSLPYSTAGLGLVKDSQSRLYAIGGEDGASFRSTVKILLPEATSWVDGDSMPVGIASFAYTASDGHPTSSGFNDGSIYIVGGKMTGGAYNGTSRDILKYTPNNAYGFTNEDGTLSGNGFTSTGNLTTPGPKAVTARRAAWRNNISVTPGSTIPITVGATDGFVRVTWGNGKSFPSNV
jgi:hypothetical protein